MASRVLTIPPHLGHVFQETRTIFELVQDIIRTNVLTMLHENWIIIVTLSVKQGTKLCEINVASRVFTRFNHIRQNALPSGGHVFQQTRIILELNQDVIETYVVTKFHTNQTINFASRVKNAPLNGGHFPEDRTINVASRALTRKNARTPGGHYWEKIFMTKFHDDRTMNVASRVLTRKNGQPPCNHVFKPTGTIFELVQYIIVTNLMTKFHDDWTINVISKVLTRFYFSHIKKWSIPWGQGFLTNQNHFQTLLTNIYEDRTINANLLTKFHGDWTINVASIVFPRKMLTPHNGKKAITKAHHEHIVLSSIIVLTKFHDRVLTRIIFPPLASMFFKQPEPYLEKNDPHPGGHLHDDQTINVAFRVKNAWPLSTITNLSTKFHENWTKDVTYREKCPPPPPCSHVFQSTRTICQFVQDIIGKNLLTNFHEVRTINVAFRVLTRHYYGHIMKNAPPPGGHAFQATTTTFEMFYNDRTINVASRVKNTPPPGGHVFQATTTIFELFYDDRTINVAFRVITRLNAPLHGGHNNQKIHEDQTINRASRVKNSLPPGSNVFQATETIFKLVQYIIRTIFRVLTRKNAPPPDDIETNLMTKFYGDCTISDYEKFPAPWQRPTGTIFILVLTIKVASRVLTRQMLTPHKRRSHTFTMINICSEIGVTCNGIAERRRVLTVTIQSQHGALATQNDYSGASTSADYDDDAFVAAVDNDNVIIMNAMLTLLAKHSGFENQHSVDMTNAPPPGHVFEPTGTIFELFHEDGAINVASRVLKRHIKKKKTLAVYSIFADDDDDGDDDGDGGGGGCGGGGGGGGNDDDDDDDDDDD
ncbi:hypothetical protein DPMN_139502 [Dreissena polymorpha]|uniref:Uncharacterized protein n=1 Tax=Dreissena polymorpha TaxID=45954 RepID=A0A9D4JI67_DREPO|nr:hypothetical protein DPMN_139502 [Dreissena polymorpha]